MLQLYMTLLFCHAAISASSTNVALYKPTSQSSTHYGYRSSKAVDGKSFTSMDSGSCTQTSLQNRPWWRVDLLESVNVWLVKITNRGDCCWDRLREFQIRVGNSLSGPDSNSLCDYSIASIDRGVTEDFVCSRARYGRYVYITLMTRDVLTLCEVEVYASDFTTISPGSLTGNIARGKPTIQSSYYFSCPNNKCRGNASRAVDGNRATIFNDDSCTHTKNQQNPWWRVDLQQREVVRKVSLTNRGDCCAERLRNVEVRVGDDGCSYSKNPVCKSFKGEVGLGFNVDLYCNRRGRFLYVRLMNKAILTLCEVQVFVEKGASLSWTKGKISCSSNRKSSTSLAWIGGVVFALFACCCFCQVKKRKPPQTAAQPAQNANHAAPSNPPQAQNSSSRTSQNPTQNTRRHSAAPEPTGLQESNGRANVRSPDNISKVKKRKPPQTAAQPAQNANHAAPSNPPQAQNSSSRTSQNPTQNTRRHSAAPEPTGLQESDSRANVRSPDNISKDMRPENVWTIPTIPFADPPPPSYDEAIQSSHANQAFEFESLSINPPYGSSIASAPPPAYPSIQTQSLEHES